MGDYPADMGPLIERRLTEADLPGEFYVEHSEIYGSRVHFVHVRKETIVWLSDTNDLLYGDEPTVATKNRNPWKEDDWLYQDLHGWKNKFKKLPSVYNRYEDFSSENIIRIFAVKEMPPPDAPPRDPPSVVPN